MGQIAFVFPGQGAQHAGMGRELAACSLAAAEIFRMADELRPGTSNQCFNGPEETLRQTAATQPCLFAVELAAEEHPAAMAAVVRLDNETVERLCAGFDGVYPVNYNCPGQVAVAGRQEQMGPFSAAVKAAGGRTIPLKVSGGFHSPFMAQAAEQFGALLEAASLRQPELPLYANCTGLPYGAELRPLLARQICSPVRWEAIVRHMIAAGADTFVEAGPGNTLCGLISKIDKNVRVFPVSDRASLEHCIAEVAKC